MANYRHDLRISTGNVAGAGTDDMVHMFFSVDGIVIGGTIRISGGGGRFEKGKTDTFYLDSPTSLHAAEYVHLCISDAVTNAPEWYCHAVVIARAGWQKMFLVDDWMRPGESYKEYPE